MLSRLPIEQLTVRENAGAVTKGQSAPLDGTFFSIPDRSMMSPVRAPSIIKCPLHSFHPLPHREGTVGPLTVHHELVDAAFLHLGRRTHLLLCRAELERVVDVGGAAVLWVSRVQLQHVWRANRQVETPQAAITPVTWKKLEISNMEERRKLFM